MRKKLLLLVPLTVLLIMLFTAFSSSVSASEYKVGDVNMDSTISTKDVVLIKQSIVGMINLTDEQKHYADAYDDGTGAINTRDAVLILQYLVGMDVTLGHTHVMSKQEASPATCTEDGNIEYWSCSSCLKYYADEEGGTEIALADTVVAASHSLTHHAAVPATCTEDGSVEYWSCSACQKNYSDAEADTEITDTVIKAAHTGGTEVRNARAATEYTDGYFGDTYCLGCGQMLAEGWVIPHTSDTPALIVSQAVQEGDRVLVSVSLVNNPGIISLKFGVLYDSVLSIESIAFADAFCASATTPEPYINPQSFNWITGGANVLADGEFVTITFLIDSAVSDGTELEIRIIPDNTNIFDYGLNQIEFDSVGTTVTVSR